MVVEILVESGVALQPERRPARSPARPNEATFRRRRAVRRAVREGMSRAPSDALIEGSVTGGIKGDNDTFEGPSGRCRRGVLENHVFGLSEGRSGVLRRVGRNLGLELGSFVMAEGQLKLFGRMSKAFESKGWPGTSE